MPEFDPDRAETVRRAFDAGVVAILCPTDLTRPASFQTVAGLTAEFPTVLAAAGVAIVLFGVYAVIAIGYAAFMAARS